MGRQIVKIEPHTWATYQSVGKKRESSQERQ